MTIVGGEILTVEVVRGTMGLLEGEAERLTSIQMHRRMQVNYDCSIYNKSSNVATYCQLPQHRRRLKL